VRSLQFVEAEGRLYSGGHDGKVLVWDVASGEQVDSFTEQSGWVTSVHVTGELVCVASVDKTVTVYDKASGEKKRALAHESWTSSLAFYNGVLFVGVGDATVCAWNPLDGELLFKMQASTPPPPPLPVVGHHPSQ
jgi:WD40 repeat protein